VFWVNNTLARARVVLVATAKGAQENVYGLTFLGGAIWLYIGIAGFSVHAADVMAGGLLMALGAVPYLLRWRKRKP
jgi:hypothetical protein